MAINYLLEKIMSVYTSPPIFIQNMYWSLFFSQHAPFFNNDVSHFQACIKFSFFVGKTPTENEDIQTFGDVLYVYCQNTYIYVYYSYSSLFSSPILLLVAARINHLWIASMADVNKEKKTKQSKNYNQFQISAFFCLLPNKFLKPRLMRLLRFL